MSKNNLYLITCRGENVVVSSDNSFNALNLWMDHIDSEMKSQGIENYPEAEDYSVQKIKGINIGN